MSLVAPIPVQPARAAEDPCRASCTLAYFVGFDFGRVGSDGKISASYARAVRDAGTTGAQKVVELPAETSGGGQR